jgi:mannan endo-1,4-beta-mannosidase
MKKILPFITLLLAMPAFHSFCAESVFQDFIRARGDQLMEGDQPFRFISYNVPNLLLIEDNMPFAEKNPWRLPNRFEITDALLSIRQAGGTVARTYTISVAQLGDPSSAVRHVLAPGKFNEKAFRAMDEVLQVANETGVRLIIPLVNNWYSMGGRPEYAAFRGKTKDDFWTDPQLIADVKQTIRFVLTRTNTLTGVPYRDDKAILCWETGNELQSPAPWTREIAAYIKSLDTNHLLMDGFYTTTYLREESLAMPEIDIVSSHHYPSKNKKDPTTFADFVRTNWAMAKGRKPYVVGEYGFVDTPQTVDMLKVVEQSGASGALAWSLRFRDRDGGFYWHTEPSGGDIYKAFHWPGFSSGAGYDEQNLVTIMRRMAFEIRGLPMPEIPAPVPPTLLPITDAAAISWQGSVGATSYVVERAADKNGPWKVVGDNVDETAVQYRPLFADTEAGKGKWFYRVSAKNASGTSAPSNIVGPVKVKHATLVDEMGDFSQIYARNGDLTLQTHNSKRTKEDAHRIAGVGGDSIVYRVGGPIQDCRLYTLFPGDIADFRFLVSADGEKFTEIPCAKTSYGTDDPRSWKPVLYNCKSTGSKIRFLKIEFGGKAEISRVEISYGE